jgi:hypothetical protein
MLNSIVQALANVGIAAKFSGKYFAEQSLKKDALAIKVDGIGVLKFPLDSATIEKLLKIAKPAAYGLRDRTLTDANVRHTHEVAGDKLHVSMNDNSFASMMDKFRAKLGIDADAKLTPHLHNMLIYQSGQFFKMHRDTEKLDNMVATMVVVLPSPHIGGDLLIQHNNDERRFVFENIDATSIECVAFYADCPHEVEKVRQGSRVVLTYNLALDRDRLAPDPSAHPALEEALKDYFDLPVSDERVEPLKLVYLLEHSYTEHSLNWQLLKGADGQRAHALAAAAQKVGLVPHLALAEIHECWSAEDEDAEPDELLCDVISLSTWFDKDNRRLPYGRCAISEDEMCSNAPYKDGAPDDEEFEGYTGNAGNTVDYWYRRAAVVLWAETDQTAMQFKFDYPAAVQSLLKLTREPGNQQAVRDMIRTSGDLLYQYRNQGYPGDSKAKQPSDYLDAFARIAAYIDHKGVAQSVLQHFPMDSLTADNVDSVLLLQERYGAGWCLGLLNQWQEKMKDGYGGYCADRLSATATEAFAHRAVKAGLELEVIDNVVSCAVHAHIRSDNPAYGGLSPEALQKSLSSRIANVGALLHAAFLLPQADSGRVLADHIISLPSHYPLTACVELLAALRKEKIPQTHQATIDIMRDYAVKEIDRVVAKGEKSADNWSFDRCLPCACEHCKTVNKFLSASKESSVTLAIIQKHRDHIMNVFRGLLLPVKISVIAKGSPHKLVLEKLPALQKEANDTFAALKRLREQLG